MGAILLGEAQQVGLAGLDERDMTMVQTKMMEAGVDFSRLAGPDSPLDRVKEVAEIVDNPTHSTWVSAVENLYGEIETVSAAIAVANLGIFTLKKASPVLSNPEYEPPKVNELTGGMNYGRGRSKEIFFSQPALLDLARIAARAKYPEGLAKLAVRFQFGEKSQFGDSILRGSLRPAHYGRRSRFDDWDRF